MRRTLAWRTGCGDVARVTPRVADDGGRHVVVNEWEERARASKAFKIARVLSLAGVPIEEWRTATTDQRVRVAVVAHVNSKPPPSDRTWTMAVDLAAEMVRVAGEAVT